MKLIRSLNMATYLAFATIFILLGTACQGDATPTEFTPPSPDPLQPTVEALAVDNARLSTQVAELEMEMKSTEAEASSGPTDTPTPTNTPVPTPTPGPTLTVPEGALTVTHEAAPDYVFVVDPELWTIGSETAPAEDFLIHSDVSDCTVNIAPAEAPGEQLQLYPQIFGLRSWLIEGYEENTFYIHKDLRLELSQTEDDDCIDAQETVLEDVRTQAEFEGEPVSDIAVRPTQRSTPEGFECEDAQAPRLAIGDRGLITAGFLWLRSDAKVDESTETKLYQQYAPAEITMTSGPVCADENVFWEVRLVELGADGETYTGWMAESGVDTYYLDIWYLGW